MYVIAIGIAIKKIKKKKKKIPAPVLFFEFPGHYCLRLGEH